MKIKILNVEKVTCELITTNEPGPQPQHKRYGPGQWCHYLGSDQWHEHPDPWLLESEYEKFMRKKGAD